MGTFCFWCIRIFEHILDRDLKFIYTESYEKILIDGIKINENGVSVLIIPDKEAPVFYVIGESYDKEKMMDAVEYWQKRVTYWRNL